MPTRNAANNAAVQEVIQRIQAIRRRMDRLDADAEGAQTAFLLYTRADQRYMLNLIERVLPGLTASAPAPISSRPQTHVSVVATPTPARTPTHTPRAALPAALQALPRMLPPPLPLTTDAGIRDTDDIVDHETFTILADDADVFAVEAEEACTAAVNGD